MKTLFPQFKKCRSFKNNFWLGRRFVFADGAGTKEKDEDAKKEKDDTSKTVTFDNINEHLQELVEKNKLTQSEAKNAKEVLKKGSEEDRKKLKRLIQDAVSGALNLGELKKFLNDFQKEQEALEEGDPSESLRSSLKSKISVETEEAISQAEILSAGAKKNQQTKEAADKAKRVGLDLKRLEQEDLKLQLPAKEKLDELVKDGHLPPELARQFLNLDFNEENAKDQWNKLVDKIKDPKAKNALDDILALKKHEAAEERRIVLEFTKKRKELLEHLNVLAEAVTIKQSQKKTLEVLESAAGVSLKPEQTLVYKEFLEDPETRLLKEVKRYATVKDVRFEDDIEIKDEEGNVIKTVQSPWPMIELETVDPHLKKFVKSKLGLPRFLEWMDEHNVTEDIQSRQDLEKSIGKSLQTGETLEYHLLLDPGNGIYSEENYTVKIEKIDELKKEIELSESVIINTSTRERTRNLSFAEFAKWYKRNEAVETIPNLKTLREKLVAHSTYLNALYKREPGEYPVIQVKEGEVLGYDDGTKHKFIIKEVTDKAIKFDNGQSLTPAGFLRWVKKNEVERKDPEIEAARATAHIDDEDVRAEQARLEHEKLEQELKERAKKGEIPPVEQAFRMTPLEQPAFPSKGALRTLWDNTTFLSLSDLFEIGEHLYEFGKRKLERGQKGRVGLMGEKIFGGWFKEKFKDWFGARLLNEISADFKGAALHAESEEVNHHAEHMRNMGIPEVIHELHTAPNKDILRAAVTVLTEKGEMRWDDPEFIKRLNQIANGHPCWVYGKEDIRRVFDDWYGPGTFKDFQSKQESGYNSVKGSFKEQAKSLENDPDRNGGLKGALQRMLYDHLHGDYVNAAQYEAYLDFAIAVGKLTFEDKIFFLLMGIGAESRPHHGHGRTLLHIDRVGILDSELMAQFPMLDYFTFSKHFQYDEEGKLIPERNEKGEIQYDSDGHPIPKKDRPDVNNFKKWIRDLIEKDFQNKGKSMYSLTSSADCTWGDTLSDFVRDEMAFHGAFQERLERAVSNASRWDHDDLGIHGVKLSEQAIEQTVSRASGAVQQVSFSGMKNMMVGFNDFSKRKLELLKQHLKKDPESAKADIRHLLNLMRSFIRFDAIVSNRYYHDNSNFSRLNDIHLNSTTGDDTKRPVREHQEEMRAFIGGLSRELGLGELWEGKIMNLKPDDKKDQEETIREFGQILEGRLMKIDGPETIFNLFNKVQEQNKKKGIHIKGSLARAKERTEQEKIEATEPHKLFPYVSREITAKVEEIQRARRKLAQQKAAPVSSSHLRSMEKNRLEKILKTVEEENYIPEEKDLKILNAELEELNKKAEGGGQNDNGL